MKGAVTHPTVKGAVTHPSVALLRGYKKRERANHCNIVYFCIPVRNTGSGVKYR